MIPVAAGLRPEDLLARLGRALAGRYRLEAPVGQGGMATVFRAIDARHDRRVALKVLHPHLASTPELQTRFLQEIRVVGRLVHPHILPMHDSGEAEGLLFYVMPYMEGESLRDRLDRVGPMPLDEVLRCISLLAPALDYAHRQGIVHRDIKPENVLLLEGQPVLADFGVALAICSTNQVRLTQVGMAIGTPAYMSPEQAAGEDSLDGRSDQYSLACVVYEMLSGHPPFAGGGARATIARHILDAPPPLTEPSNLPAGAERAIMKALSKDPGDRFATVTHFVEGLELAGRGPPVSGGARTITRDERNIAVLPFVNTGPNPDDEYLSDGLTEELIQALAQVDGLHVASRTSVYAWKDRAQDVRTIGAALGAAFLLEGTVRRVGNRLRIGCRLVDAADGRLVWSGRYDRASEDLQDVEEQIARTIVATLRASVLTDLGEPPPRRATENPQAYHLYLRGRHAWNRRTTAGMDEAQALFQQAVALDPGFALAYTGLADVHTVRLDYGQGQVREAMEEARREAERALALDDTLAEAHTSLAWVTFIYDWKWPEAERRFRRAIELDPGYATARQWYSWLLLALGRDDEALDEGRTALELDPASVSIRRSVGWLYHMVRQPDPALAYLRRAIVLDPASSETHRILGHAYLQKQEHGAAIAVLEQAVALEPGSAYAAASLGAARLLAGDRRAAERTLADLLAAAGDRYITPVAFAVLHAAMRDADGLFQALEDLWRDRRGWLAYLRSEPLLDPYRTDPRFRGWLERMRLV